MKKALLMFFILCLTCGTVWSEEIAADDDISGVVAELKKTVDAQNQRIKELEQAQQNELPQIEAMVKQYSKKDGWLPSTKGEKFELGGELEFEMHINEEDTSAESSANGLFADGTSTSQTFDMDKSDIYLKAKWNDRLKTFFEIEFFENAAHIDTAWAQFALVKDDNNDIFLRAGLDHQFTKYSRTTETYPMAGGIFWRDEYNQVRLHGEHSFGMNTKWFYWDAVVGNSFTVDTTTGAFGENRTKANDLLQDDNDATKNLDGNFQYGLGVGVKPDFKEYGKFDIRGWWIASKLRDTNDGYDMSEIAGTFFTSNGIGTTDSKYPNFQNSGATSNDDDKNQLGFRAIYTNKFMDGKVKFKGIFEYIKANDGPVDRDTWYVEGSAKIKLEGFTFGKDEKWFTSITPFVRYEDLDIDDRYDNQISAPSTWDRQRILLGVNFGVAKHVKFRVEYSINDENIDHAANGRLNDSTISSVDNDELLFQLELKF